jgi:iron transport multicopper oxidase
MLTRRSAFFNGITYISPKVPSLYTALSAGALATNASIYGPNTNAFILAQNDVIELIINSNDRGKHPFHLHGHAMQIAARGQKNDGAFNASNTTLSQVPMRRDTILVNPQSHAVLRFQATNPGVWLFHCHIEWHMDSGLVATMIESPLQLQAQNLSIPALHKDACATQGRPTSGNAAGKGLAAAAGQPVPDASAWMDLSGANTSPAPLPAGFTTSGIVALAFSCLSAFLGLAVVVWYGVGEIKAPKPASAPPAAGVKSE